MQSENPGILTDKRKQRGQILKMLSIYCRKHLMTDLDLGAMSPDAMDRLGSEIVDLFLDGVPRFKQKAPPEKETLSGNGVPRTRGRTLT